MSVWFDIFYANLLPVLLVAGAGFLFGRLVKPDIRVTNRLALYVLSPCLVFSLIAQSEVGGQEFGQIALLTVMNVLLAGGMTWGGARALHLNSAQTRAVMLAVMFVNAGNFGLAVNHLAFGETGLARAAVYFVTNSLLVYTLGLYIAAGHGVSPQAALKRVFSVPPVHAVVLAGLVRVTGCPLPAPVLRAITLIGQAAVPVFLLILGVQLSSVTRLQHWRPVIMATGVRLVIAPLMALGLAPMLGLTGPAYQASITQAGMPAAVINTILASEHEVEPGLVSSIVMLSTLLSPFTLTLIIAAVK